MSWYVEVYNVALLVLFHTKKISSSTQLIKKMFLMLQNYSLKVFELFSRVSHQPFFSPSFLSLPTKPFSLLDLCMTYMIQCTWKTNNTPLTKSKNNFVNVFFFYKVMHHCLSLSISTRDSIYTSWLGAAWLVLTAFYSKEDLNFDSFTCRSFNTHIVCNSMECLLMKFCTMALDLERLFSDGVF